MSTPIWPSTLPQRLLQSGYSQAPASNRISQDMDVGPAKVRRRSAAGPRPVTGSIMVTLEELQIFEAFYVEDLMSGTLRFSWVDPIHTDTTVEMRFKEDPTWVARDINFEVSMSLEILP